MKPADMTKTIDLINAEIRPFDQKIALYEFGLTNDEFYVFYSTAKTSISKLQNSYNEAELDFFKLILTKIVKHEQLNIAPIDALNLCTAITGAKLNKLRAQKLLANWIQSKYFFQHDDNKIYLGPKVLYEFSELLQGMELNYLKSCLLCEAIAAWVRSSKLFTQFEADFSCFPHQGERCASCDSIFHTSCIRKFIARTAKCPSCKEKWEVPQAAAAVGDDD